MDHLFQAGDDMKSFRNGDIVKCIYPNSYLIKNGLYRVLLSFNVEQLYKMGKVVCPLCNKSDCMYHLKLEGNPRSLYPKICRFVKATDREEFLYYTHGSLALKKGNKNGI